MTDLASLELRIESRQVGKARDALGRFVASGKSAERSASLFERSARRLSGTAGVLGKSLGGLSPIVLGLGGAAGFRGLVGILREFEDGLVGVSKTTGLAGNGLRGLEQDIERMATNSSTAIDGLFGIAEAAGQLDIRGRESLGGFTDAISKLADAAPSLRGDIDGTALSMGKLLSITGASADETFNLASVIAQLEDSYSTVANKILGTGLEVAKAGAAYDVSAQQALGLAAAFDSIGTEAELSRSAVVSVFGEMSKAIATNSPKLATFATLAGKSVEDFSSGFKEDAVGGFQGFIEGLDQLIQQGGQAGLVLADLGLGSKRLQPTLLTLAKDSQRLGDVLKTAAEEFETGAKLEREFEAGSDRLTASLGRMTNTFGVLVDNILDDSTGFAGALRQTTEGGTDVLRVLAGMDDQVRGNVDGTRLLASGIVGVTGALAAYVAIQATATAGAIAFSLATLSNPFAAVALAVGAAAGALFLYKDTFVEIGDDFATVGSLVGAAFDVGVDRLGIAMKIGAQIVGVGWEAISDATNAGLNAMIGSFTGTALPFGLEWTDLWDEMVRVVRTSINRMIGLANIGAQTIAGAFTGLSSLGDDIARAIAGELTAVETLGLGGRIAKAFEFDPAGLIKPPKDARKTLFKDYIAAAGSAGSEGASAFGEEFAKSLKLSGVDVDGLLDAFDPDQIAKEIRDKASSLRELTKAVGEIDFAVLSLVFGFKTLGGEISGATESGEGFNEKIRDLEGLLNGNIAKAFEADTSRALDNLIIKTEDLGFALEHALDLDADRRNALAIRDLGFDLDAAGASAGDAANFLDGFGLALDRLTQLERIRNISREFAVEMGAGFKDLITGAKSFEESINNVGRAISDVALDRFVIDPLVDSLTGTFAGIGADLTAKGSDDPTGAGALAGLLDPTATLGASLGGATLQVTAFSTALVGATAATTASAGGELADSFVGPRVAESATGGLGAAGGALAGLTTPATTAGAALGTVAAPATTAGLGLSGLAAPAATAGIAMTGVAAPAGVLGGTLTSLATSAALATAALQALAAQSAAKAVVGSVSALGNVFSGAGVHKFAQGGAFAGGRGLRGSIGDMLVNGPVSFPLGVAGEAGPEAILEAMKFGGGFGVKGILGNEQVNVGLTRDSSGSLVVDLGTLKQKARPFKDGAAFNRGFTPPVSQSSGRGAARRNDESRGAGPTYVTNQTYNIKTPDPKSFGRSLKQQRTDASRALGNNRRP